MNRAIDPEIIESIGWLAARIPGCVRELDAFVDGVAGRAGLMFSSPDGGVSTWIAFETPHRVRCERFRAGCGTPDVSVFNLAMNLQEILDMIRRTLEGE